jgi:hypothetical protein
MFIPGEVLPGIEFGIGVGLGLGIAAALVAVAYFVVLAALGRLGIADVEMED